MILNYNILSITFHNDPSNGSRIVPSAIWHMEPLLGNGRITNEIAAVDSGPRATVEVLVEAVFSMWSAPRLYDPTDQGAVQLRKVKWSKLVDE
jgi:hypothetical protein